MSNILIGISGHIGSGKDTIGKMIQYLRMKANLESGGMELYGQVKHFDIFDKWDDKTRQQYGGFEIRKFAYKLKLMVSILLGIPVEDLEKQEVKDRVLGPEWKCWWYTDGVGNKILTSSEETARMEHSRAYGEQLLTIREVLQLMGTDAIRHIIHPNAWVNALFADYKLQKHPNPVLRSMIFPSWIITDVRFPNEAEAIRDRGGILIRTERLVQVKVEAGSTFTAQALHASETALDDYKYFNYKTHNNGSKDDLLLSVQTLLRKEKII